MTTDKPKWWQKWIMCVVVALVALPVAYVGGYLLLGETGESLLWGKTRSFEYRAMRVVFGPAGRAEARISGEAISIIGPDETVVYFPDGDTVSMVHVPLTPGFHIDP